VRTHQQIVRFGTRVLSVARSEQLTMLAAAVAFYAFLSLVPLSLLGLGVLATLGGESLVTQVVALTDDVLTPSAQQVLAETLVEDAGRQGATVVGALGLLWAASRVLRGLDQMFAAVYGTVSSQSTVDTLWDSMIVLLAVLFGIGSVAGIELVLEGVLDANLGVLGTAFTLLGLFVAFYPMYVVFPDVDVGLVDALPGAVFAAFGWFLLSQVFVLYGVVAGEYTAYGAIGGVFLVLIWLYAGAAIMIVGVIVNAVLADPDGNRQLQSPGQRHVSPMADDLTGPDDEADADRGTDRDPAPPGAVEEPPSERADRTRASARTADRADDPAVLREELRQLEERLESFETDVDRRTVDRDSLEADLKRYVRRRVRRGHARGWGPYVVLGYGTAMTVAAFYFLSGLWAVLAMLVVWTSTLGGVRPDGALWDRSLAVGRSWTTAQSRGRVALLSTT